jgi:signal transduction histidine kinase
MERTLTNLIENAVHHSPPESVVDVGLKATEGTVTSGVEVPPDGPTSSVTVSISDEGPGLSGEERERVFQRYYTGSAGGTGRGGLGLAIARRIVELHGGTIGVRNKPDGGSIFSFTVPL